MKATVFRPGDRVELNEHSGNEGRKAFVLYIEADSDLVVRFDGFAYNTSVPAERFRLLPPEPFRALGDQHDGPPANACSARKPCGSCEYCSVGNDVFHL